MDILDQNIDESVADFILKKLEDYKGQLDTQLDESNQSLTASFDSKKEKLLEHVEGVISEREDEIREEYSARAIAKIQEKNEQLQDLEEKFDSYKESLSEKVHTFLSNSKTEVRSLVEEEIRMDSEHLKAERTVDEIKALVGNTTITTVDAVDEGKVARLSEDVEVLKERLESKTAVADKFKAKLKAFELCESVPTGDREFYLSQLGQVGTVNEAEETFAKLKRAARAARLELVEEAASVEPAGRIDEDDTDHSPRVLVNEDSESTNRMKQLAGI